jgi:DNA helicase II / ATP-dependent DNA helicase PcrA
MKKYTLHRDTTTRRSLLDYEKDLNEEQLKVVMAPDGPILVIAGAGSGKTRVVTYRVAYLLERGVSPQAILLLTFTNKAAREMLLRVERLIKMDTRYIWGGTFHHIGNLILRQNSARLGFTSSFTILDNEDAKDIVELSIKDAKIDTRQKRFPKAQVLKEVFSYSANTLVELKETIEERFPHFREIMDEIITVRNIYSKKKREANAMDFDDLLYFWHNLLAQDEALRRQYATIFSHILVDEYQDTNRLQAEIVDFMGLINRNVTVVGDDAQSVYSFRGADFKNILEFPRRYTEATVYRLETNYRSTPEILDLANNSISHNTEQFEKNLKAVKPNGIAPVVTALRDVIQQAEFVAQRIEDLRNEGVQLNEIAVLYRAHYHCMELQMELTRRDTAFEIRSGLRFFEQAHIKDVIAFLRVMVNKTDEVSWKRIFTMFPRIGKKTAERIYEYIKISDDPVSLFVTKKISDKFPSIQRQTIDTWSALFTELEELQKNEAPGDMMSAVLKYGYLEYLKYTYPNHENRLEDIGQIINFSSEYHSLVDFLSELSLMSGVSGEEVANREEQDRHKVVLSTIHQAKGLEWKAVFVIWCAEGRFPNPRAVEDGETEEERRLFYVASTRAMDELYLCYPMLYFDRQMGHIIVKPSRFIGELKRGLYEEWQIGED